MIFNIAICKFLLYIISKAKYKGMCFICQVNFQEKQCL